MVKRSELFDKCVDAFEDNNMDNIYFEVKWIFHKVFGKEDNEKEVTDEEKQKIECIVKKRIEGHPLQYLLEEWEFYGMRIKVGEGVLIPRQDTETLVDVIIRKMKERKGLILADLCSGSGCIALALEKYLDCKEVYCVEKSEKAVEYLKENAGYHNSKAKIINADVLEKETIELVPDVDILVCNPPYLTEKDMKELQKEVRFEPETALFGGVDGLDFYRGITRIWKDKIREKGLIVFEVGIGQEDEVMRILIQHGFVNVRCKADLCGVNRCVFGYKPETVQEIGQKIDFDKLSKQTDK